MKEALLQERERLYDLLKGVPFLEPYPSHSNFILCAVKSGMDAKKLKVHIYVHTHLHVELVKYYYVHMRDIHTAIEKVICACMNTFLFCSLPCICFHLDLPLLRLSSCSQISCHPLMQRNMGSKVCKKA